MSVLGLILSSTLYLRSAKARFPLKKEKCKIDSFVFDSEAGRKEDSLDELAVIL